MGIIPAPLGWEEFLENWCICKCLTSMAQNGMSQGTSKRHKNKNWLGGVWYFHLYLGKIPILTDILQMGWNHQLVECF